MESYQKELTQIKIILKNNPRGMTVTDIAREININRNSVAKYLDILLISGHAEMVTFGPAKVFFPSRRIPLSAVLNFTKDYILLFDKDLKIIQANANIVQLFNMQWEEIIGQNINTLTLPFFKIPEITENIKKALQGNNLTTETKYDIHDHVLYLSIKYIPTTFDNGEPGVTLIIEDITERKNTENKIHQIIREWETTFNSVSEMISILDNNHTITRVNKSFADFFQLSPEECIGKKCYMLLHGTNKPRAACPCEQLQQQAPVIIEFFEEKIGKKLQISASPIKNDAGNITGMVHIMRDLSKTDKTGF